jgi:ribosome-binding factor A
MSKRCEQVSSELQHQLSELIVREIELPIGSMVTIMRVTVSPDLKIAKIYISVLPENKRGTALDYLNRTTSIIRNKLKSRIYLYTLPELRFFVDEHEIKRREVSEALDKG